MVGYIYIIIIKGVTTAGSTQRHYIDGESGEEKDRKSRKSRSEEKVVGFSSTFLFPARKRGGSHPGWNHLNRVVDHLTRRKIQGAGIVKGWKENDSAVLLIFPASDDTSFLGSPLYQVVYPPGSTLSDCLLFPCGKEGG